MRYCVEHNSYEDGQDGQCVYARTHTQEIVPCQWGVDPDYDPYWD